jgi:hypothetical protein
VEPKSTPYDVFGNKKGVKDVRGINEIDVEFTHSSFPDHDATESKKFLWGNALNSRLARLHLEQGKILFAYALGGKRGGGGFTGASLAEAYLDASYLNEWDAGESPNPEETKGARKIMKWALWHWQQCTEIAPSMCFEGYYGEAQAHKALGAHAKAVDRLQHYSVALFDVLKSLSASQEGEGGEGEAWVGHSEPSLYEHIMLISTSFQTVVGGPDKAVPDHVVRAQYYFDMTLPESTSRFR